ncbi:M23 family metallopeptidase [Rubidibacter lacunae]|nr:peptidoglycan DD-metalloendopeptidase family protein [Rubidibacter lacunae]
MTSQPLHWSASVPARRWFLRSFIWLGGAGLGLLSDSVGIAQSALAPASSATEAFQTAVVVSTPAPESLLPDIRPAIATVGTSASDLHGTSGWAIAQSLPVTNSDEVSLPDLPPLVPAEQKGAVAVERDATQEDSNSAIASPPLPADAPEVTATVEVTVQIPNAVSLPPLEPIAPPRHSLPAQYETLRQPPATTVADAPAAEDGKNRLVDPVPYSIGTTTASAPTVRLRNRTTGCETVVQGEEVTLSCDPTRAGASGFSPELPPPPALPSIADLGPAASGTAIANVPLPEAIALPSDLPPPPHVAAELEALQLPGNGDTELLFPLLTAGSLSSSYGWRIHPIFHVRHFHTGADLAAPFGTPVVAAYSGRVETAAVNSGYGLLVTLRHADNAQESRYGHLSSAYVRPGEWVEQGQVIGRVGSSGNSTGPHLHFEWRIRKDGRWVAVDPGAQLLAAARGIFIDPLALPEPRLLVASDLVTGASQTIKLDSARTSWLQVPDINSLRLQLEASVNRLYHRAALRPRLVSPDLSLPNAIAAALPWNIARPVFPPPEDVSAFWRAVAAITDLFERIPAIALEPQRVETETSLPNAIASPLPEPPSGRWVAADDVDLNADALRDDALDLNFQLQPHERARATAWQLEPERLLDRPVLD